MLPEIGQITAENQGDVVTYIGDLVLESSNGEKLKYEQLVDMQNAVYTWGSDEEPDDSDEIVANPIQNAVIAGTDIQIKDPPQPTLEPVETGERPMYYWCGPPMYGLQMGLSETQVTPYLDPETQQINAPDPIDPDTAEQILAMAVPKGAAMPGQIHEEWIVGVDDRLVADVYQAVFNVHWERCDADFYIQDNLLDTNVQGTAFGLYQFDDANQRHVLKHLPIPQVHMDPTARDIQDAAYAGFDIPMDAAEAKLNFPDLAELIESKAVTGNPVRIDGLTRWGATHDRDFKRRMVVFRVMWLRNQVRRLTKDEAVAQGLVDERQVMEAKPLEAPAEDDLMQLAAAVEDRDALMGNAGFKEAAGADADEEATLTGEASNERPAATDDADEQPDAEGGDAGPAAGGGDPDATEAVGADAAAEPVDARPDGDAEGVLPAAAPAGNAVVLVARLACFLAGTDIEVTPESDSWPTMIVTRQVTQLADQIVDDRESEFFDIPILHNVNIPLPGARPFGLGEPLRLQGMQKAYNRTLNYMVDSGDWHAHPPAVISESMNASLPDEYKDSRAKPGITYIVPDAVYNQAKGQIEVFQNPPPLSQAHTFLAAYLNQLLDQESGNSEVLQGRANSQIQSGRAIQMLQSAATSMIGFKSRRTGRMVKRLANLMLHSLVWRTGVDDIRKIVSKYPPHVMAAIHDRARQIEWNIRVVVQAGTGGVQMQKRQLAQMDLSVGAISMQSYREKASIDDRVEKQRMRQEQQEQARLMALSAPAEATPEEGKAAGGGQDNGGEQQRPSPFAG